MVYKGSMDDALVMVKAHKQGRTSRDLVKSHKEAETHVWGLGGRLLIIHV